MAPQHKIQKTKKNKKASSSTANAEPNLVDLSQVLEKQASRKRTNPKVGHESMAHSAAPVLQAPEALPNELIQEMRTEISEMKKQSREQQHELLSVRAKLAVKEGADFAWKKDGNRHQFDILYKIVDTAHQSKIVYSTRGITAGEQKLKDLRETATGRIKLLKIADSSPHGWNTVAEYEARAFTKDEADDKKLKNAEKSAADKQALKNQEKRNRQSRFSPYQQGPPSFGQNNFYRGNFPGPNSFNEATPYRAYGGFKNTNMYRPSTVTPDKPMSRRNINNDLCYNCGGRGHWANTCTEKKPEMETKQ